MEGEADAEVWRQSEGAIEIEVERSGDEVSSYAESWIRSSKERMFVVSSFAVLRKCGELPSQKTAEGEVGSTGRVLYHVERSMLVCKPGTCLVSSGVDGVTGDGEREAVVVREGDAVDMTGEGR